MIYIALLNEEMKVINIARNSLSLDEINKIIEKSNQNWVVINDEMAISIAEFYYKQRELHEKKYDLNDIKRSLDDIYDCLNMTQNSLDIEFERIKKLNKGLENE